jgi:hypothetical protein
MVAEALVANLVEQRPQAGFDLMKQWAAAAVRHPAGVPWHLWRVDNGLEIRSGRSLRTPSSRVGGRTVRVTAGAALATIRLGTAVYGHRPVVTLLPGPRRSSVLAVIRRGGAAEPTAWERLLFAAIPAIGRCLPPIGDGPVPEALVHRTRAAVEAEGLWLRSVDDADRARLACQNTSVAALPLSARLMVIGSNHDVSVAHLRAGLALQGLVLAARAFGGTAAVLGWPADLACTPLPASISGYGLCPQLFVAVGRPGVEP